MYFGVGIRQHMELYKKKMWTVTIVVATEESGLEKVLMGLCCVRCEMPFSSAL
jgi:hypothetical protein